MVTEIATITVAPGREAEFEAAMRGAGVGFLAACPGVQSVRFGQGIEKPQNFTFVVEWDSIEAHNAARDCAAFGQFRGCFGDMSVGGAMEHFDLR